MPPIDNLPNAMVMPSRDTIRDKYLRDYGLRNPSADTSQKSQPYIDASVEADTLVPLYANIKKLGEYAAGQNHSGAALVADAKKLGTAPLPAAGATGFVLIAASSGGGTIYQGDEIRALNNGGLRYQCLRTSRYLDGDAVPVGGIDTGPATNLPAGTILTWTTPRPGIAPKATVQDQGGGAGLTDGRNAESDQDLDTRLIALRADPPASGNDAEYQAAIAETPGIFPQQGFTYPAIVGPGSMAFCFTLRPASPGASRKPSAAQIASVLAYIVGLFPGDDSISACSIVEVPTAIKYAVTWAIEADGWVDLSPWPDSTTAPTVTTVPGPALATNFWLTSGAGSPVAPQVGQSIAFYDAANQAWRQKKIAFVTGSNPWNITVTTDGSSDTTYAPVSGQLASPWSDSLVAVTQPTVSYFDSLGPGEQVASFFDPGLRQRRSPRSPGTWPSQITRKILAPLDDLPTIEGIDLLSPSTPYATPVGTAGVSSNLLTLGDIAVYPA